MLNFSYVFALLSLVMSEFPCSLTKKTIGLQWKVPWSYKDMKGE